MKIRTTLLLIAGVLLVAGAARADSRNKVAEFNETGILVDIQHFFRAAESEMAATADVGKDGVSGVALVTRSGIYAFLETPENAEHLQGIEPGSAVKIQGQLLQSASLLHIESLEQVMEAPDVELTSYRMAQGKEMTLTGVNKCQCGLDVGSLPHNCQLGHLHHLEADDGQIYHYLQFQDGQEAFLGNGSHFKQVSVQAQVLPGNYLLVKSMMIQ